MPYLNVPPSQVPILSSSYGSRQEPCVLFPEQSKDSVELRTCSREYSPRAPPPSPTKSTPLDSAERNEIDPASSCVLLLVDQKIEAYQARLSPAQHSQSPASYFPSLMNDSVFGMKLECSDGPMHRLAPLHQNSSASDDDDMTVTNSSCPSSRSSGTIPSDREVDPHTTAIGIPYYRKLATSSQLAAQPSSPESPTFSLFSLRSSRDATADASSRFGSTPRRNDAFGPRPMVTGRLISSPTPIGSSAIPDIASSPLEYKQSKTKSWPGTPSQLPGLDSVNTPKATQRSRPHKCDFVCACCIERKARCDGGMPSCETCVSRGEACSISKYGLHLEPLKEHANGEEAMDEQQTVEMEEERSHFSDYSSEDEDDSEKVPSNGRLFNSLGRHNQRSKPRLSWSNLFSKP